MEGRAVGQLLISSAVRGWRNWMQVDFPTGVVSDRQGRGEPVTQHPREAHVAQGRASRLDVVTMNDQVEIRMLAADLTEKSVHAPATVKPRSRTSMVQQVHNLNHVGWS